MGLSGAVILGDTDEWRERQLVDRQLAMAKQLDRALKAEDPYLSLVFVNEKADAPGLHPGRWHIKRENPETMDVYLPIIADNGAYVEPSMDIIDKLRSNDLWREDVARAVRKAQVDKREAGERARLEADLEKRDEFAGRVKAMSNPSINYGGKGWKARLGDEKRG